MTGRWLAATVFVATAVFVACDKPEPADPPVRLDGSARHPDDQGVATSITRREITLDGERTYGVSDDLRSFSTVTQELEPMRKREGQYVLVGLDADKVVWMAGVAGVVSVAGERSVFYTGSVVRNEGRDIVFADGTVLTRASSVVAPRAKSLIRTRIDAARHLVVDIR